MNSRIYFIILLIFGQISQGFSQQNHHYLENDCFLCKENDHKNESPYHLTFKNELPYIIVGTALAASGLIFRYTDNTVPYSPIELNALDRNDVNSFDRGATYNWDPEARETSDIIAVGGILMPAFFLINHHTRKDFGNLVIMGLEVTAINYGITNTVKSLVNRTRPYAYNKEAGLSYEQRTDLQSRFSFFSGHTSVTASYTFFFAKVMTDYHPNMKTGWKIGIWSFAAALPAVTGVYRIKAGVHYRTDVLSGYVIGALTGWLVPHLHKKQKLSSKWSFYPTRVFNVQGMGVTFKF